MWGLEMKKLLFQVAMVVLLFTTIHSPVFAQAETVPFPDDLDGFNAQISELAKEGPDLFDEILAELNSDVQEESGCSWYSDLPGFCGEPCTEIRLKNLLQLFLPNPTCVLLQGTCKRDLLFLCSCAAMGGKVLAEFPCKEKRK